VTERSQESERVSGDAKTEDKKKGWEGVSAGSE
jgi:hypothetical protein